MCYRDKTWCEFHSECKDGNKCSRALTEDVIKAANKWWGKPDAPIMIFLDKPECFKSIEVINCKPKTIKELTEDEDKK